MESSLMCTSGRRVCYAESSTHAPLISQPHKKVANGNINRLDSQGRNASLLLCTWTLLRKPEASEGKRKKGSQDEHRADKGLGVSRDVHTKIHNEIVGMPDSKTQTNFCFSTKFGTFRFSPTKASNLGPWPSLKRSLLGKCLFGLSPPLS